MAWWIRSRVVVPVLSEELLDLSGLRVGETDQRLLGAPEVKRRTPPSHGIFEASDVAVTVPGYHRSFRIPENIEAERAERV
jgi:hypothetical protein